MNENSLVCIEPQRDLAKIQKSVRSSAYHYKYSISLQTQSQLK